MTDSQDVKNRIREFINYLHISTKAFEESCGLSNGYVSSIRKGIGHRALEQITEAYPELSKIWLLTGDGPMIVDKSTQINIRANSIGNQANTVHGNQIAKSTEGPYLPGTQKVDQDYKNMYYEAVLKLEAEKKEANALRKALMDCKDECVRITNEVIKEKERYVLLLEKMTK